MPMSLEELKSKVRSQKEIIPSLYGEVDFEIVPERFAGKENDVWALPKKISKKYRSRLLKDSEKMERALAYTMLGDSVADAYAALMPQYGFRKLVEMLKDACDNGVEKVADAPQELIDFIHAMEKIPDWLDMELVEAGARVARVMMAEFSPFVIRGVFLATFMNKYSGLPMALTGTLSDEKTSKRIKETASFFTTATLPGALKRFGPGFKAAAMVRLMHSMVRFNILKRSKKWDINVYGIPIPQVDQMPAGTVGSFLAAFRCLREGRKEFNDQERAIVEFNRYQCYLLGLPEDLLPDNPRGIADAMMMYQCTLRDGYDEEMLGDLVRSTMKAYLPVNHTLANRLKNKFETSFAKVFFNIAFLTGSMKKKAVVMGLKPNVMDYALSFVVGMYLVPRVVGHLLLEYTPIAKSLADKQLVRKINELLVEYGHAEYTTDHSKYKEASEDVKHAA